MSVESSVNSWPPQTNSAKSGSGPEEPDSENRRAKSLEELPTPEEKVREFLEVFGERAHVPMSTTHGRELRPGAFEEETEVSKYVMESGGTERVEEVVERRALPWWQAVANMLEWHADYHRSRLRLEYGQESDPMHEVLDVDLDNSWFAAYQDEDRAKLKAVERETCGFETCDECDTRYCQEPDEHETEHVAGEFEQPVVVLDARTASGAGRPPVDHAREIADSWKDGGVRRSLRYIFEKLGLDSDDWVRWTQGEPHPGEGENRGYHHPHDVMILDAGGLDEKITPATFRPLIESHVEATDHAGPEAHDLTEPVEEWEAGNVDTVSVKYVDGEIEESVASYAAAYLANESKDLLERSPEYLAWAAAMWASESQKGKKSDSAIHAIAADKCKYEYESGDSETAHGDRVRRREIRGQSKIVCASCGSPWGIDQDQTLTSARLEASGASEPVAADGGRDEPESREERVEEELRDRWPSARSAAVVETRPGEHDGVDVVTAGFDRPPQWRAKAIIRDGEEIPASGGTSNRKPLDLRSSPESVVAMAGRPPGVIKCFECGCVYDSISGYLEHGCDTGKVGVGWLAGTDPPAEESVMDRQEFVGAIPERYKPGGGRPDHANDEDAGESDSVLDLPERVLRFIEDHPGVGVPGVLGRFHLSPDARQAVESVL